MAHLIVSLLFPQSGYGLLRLQEAYRRSGSEEFQSLHRARSLRNLATLKRRVQEIQVSIPSSGWKSPQRRHYRHFRNSFCISIPQSGLSVLQRHIHSVASQATKNKGLRGAMLDNVTTSPLAKRLLRWHFRRSFGNCCVLTSGRRVLIDSGCLRNHRQCATNDHTEGQDKQIVGDELQVDRNPCEDEYRYLKAHIDYDIVEIVHAIITP